MGYTHYWYINVMGDPAKYDAALDLVRTVVHRAPKKLLANGMGGVATKPELGDGVMFNGVGDDAHETFHLFQKLPELLSQDFVQQDKGGFVFTFCKTAGKPYDYIVTACLAVLKDVLGDDIRVSSDGEPADWVKGVTFANTAASQGRAAFLCPDLAD